MKGSSALWKWMTASAAVSAAILLSYSLRPLQMVVCTQEISSSCWVNVSLYQGSNPMCCQDTDSQRQQDSKCHRWAESNYKFIICCLTYIAFSLQWEERNNQISGLPYLHLFLRSLKSDCTGYLKIWDMPVLAHDNSLWITRKTSVHHCLQWWKFAFGKI